MSINFITKKALSRRTVLHGVGATIALPLLDSMVPALSAPAKTAGNMPLRFGVVYEGNGASLPYWVPKSVGSGFEMSYTLKPLEPFRSKVLVLSGMDNLPAVAHKGDPGGGHGRCSPSFLSGTHVKPTEAVDYYAATTIDQIIANKIGGNTQLRSLEVALEGTEFSGSCDAGYSCAYTSTVCWNSPTKPMAMENNPRMVFEMMFGDSSSTNKARRLARLQERKSVLDSVGAEAKALQRSVGASDNAKLQDYLESLRETERRIEIAEAHMPDLPAIQRPTSIPASVEDHAKLMYDLQVLAYQTDMTRVITFMTIRELSGRAYPFLGVPGSHHALSHHRDDPTNLALLARINLFHMELFAYYLGKLQATPDGDGSLLDHVMILKGSGMGNSNLHDPHNLPLLVAGGAMAQLKSGQHLSYKAVPLANLLVTVLNTFGVPTESLADSTGHLDINA